MGSAAHHNCFFQNSKNANILKKAKSTHVASRDIFAGSKLYINSRLQAQQYGVFLSYLLVFSSPIQMKFTTVYFCILRYFELFFEH